MSKQLIWIALAALTLCLAACTDATPPPPPANQQQTLNEQLNQGTIGATPTEYAGKGTLIDTQARELQRAKNLQQDLNKAVEARRDAADKME